MPGKAAKVTITERQQAILMEFSKSRSEPLLLVQRATIILLAFDRQSNDEISLQVNLNRQQVGTWRRRWADAWRRLTVLECGDPRQLREGIRDVLRDAPRSGWSGKFSAEQVGQILAVACEPPDKSGRPITHWTHKELRDEVVKRKIVPKISESQVGRYLKEAALRPHRRKMWINTTEKDPVKFQEQMEQVCEAYLQAPALHEQNGTRTVSIDEMTGLQALERNAPDKAALPGADAKQEFEYTRHGTTTLIGTLDVVSGHLISETIGATRTEEVYICHIQQTVASDPDVSWVIIVDNLNIHLSAGLVEWVAKICTPDLPLGKKRETEFSNRRPAAARSFRTQSTASDSSFCQSTVHG